MPPEVQDDAVLHGSYHRGPACQKRPSSKQGEIVPSPGVQNASLVEGAKNLASLTSESRISCVYCKPVSRHGHSFTRREPGGRPRAPG